VWGLGSWAKRLKASSFSFGVFDVCSRARVVGSRGEPAFHRRWGAILQVVCLGKYMASRAGAPWVGCFSVLTKKSGRLPPRIAACRWLHSCRSGCCLRHPSGSVPDALGQAVPDDYVLSGAAAESTAYRGVDHAEDVGGPVEIVHGFRTFFNSVSRDWP